MKICSRLDFATLLFLPLLWLGMAATPAVSQTPRSATVNRIALLGSDNGLALKITSTAPVATDTQVLSGPDRIVIDFPGALPGTQLRGFQVHQAGVREVRVGLFEANPPRTRVVVDLERPMEYQLVPSGNSVFVKLGSGSAPSLVSVSTKASLPIATAKVTPPPPAPNLQVSYVRGLLQINVRKATLAEVLYQIQQRTAADIAIPAGAEQEQVAINVGPGPAKEVMAALLNGSRFNVVLVGSAQNPNELRTVILTPKMDGGYQQVITATQPAVAPPPQPEPESQPEPEFPPGTEPHQVTEAQPAQQAPIADQGQTIPPPTAPPPPPTQNDNQPWTEPPPGNPQPD